MVFPLPATPLCKAIFSSNPTFVLSTRATPFSRRSSLSPPQVLPLLPLQTGEFLKARTAFRTVLAKEGVRGLFAGYGSFLLRDLPFDALEFFSYEQAKVMWKAAVGGRELTPGERIAEMPCLGVARRVVPVLPGLKRGKRKGVPVGKTYGGTRLGEEYEGGGGWGRRSKKKGKKDGLFVESAWRGRRVLWKCSCLRAWAVFAPIFGLRMLWLAVETSAIGAVAGAWTGFITTPLDVLKTRLMTQGSKGQYTGVVDCAIKVTGIARGGLACALGKKRALSDTS